MPGYRGELRHVYTRRGNSYEIDLRHDELAKHRTVRGSDPHFVIRMASVQLEQWDEQWQRAQLALARRTDARLAQESREEKKRYQEAQKSLAETRTSEAKQLLDGLANLLRQTLAHDDTVDWEQLKDHAPFQIPRPFEPTLPVRSAQLPVAPEPLPTDGRYQPELGLLDKLLSKRREQRAAEANALYRQDHAAWEAHRGEVLAANTRREQEFRQEVQILQEMHRQELATWEGQRAAFLKSQQEQSTAIDSQREQYLRGVPEVIVGYCDMVLSNSQYPDFFPKEWDLDYSPETKVLLLDYRLPAPGNLPTLVEVKYVAARDEFAEKHLSEAQVAKLYDELVYQVVLRTIHELFEADQVHALEAVIFNGHVRSIDRGTGNETDACVLSLQANREAFLAINLENVDPRACFRQLKGVGSSKLHSITAVAPIMRIRRDDGRFVAAHEVAHQLDEGYNLAAMGWEDFEHLIREVFEKEFAAAGGEVRVTQASRDGGVDAVIFDPDPIRGGKIVVQAKRYTSTVGVSAVRDLYGTALNEGATKGILVTTSDFGPDAYEFASGKPITLLNGGNLLHLLEKHGHQARIDLNEARRLALQQRSG